MIHHPRDNDESFPKMQFLLQLSNWIKSYGRLSEILAYVGGSTGHDLSLIILKSRDLGC